MPWRDCGEYATFRASIRMMARSAVDAPVAILRVILLFMARRIGNDEFAFRRRKIAVSNVDGNALLAFGAKSVGQQRQIDVPAGPIG